jgi:alkylation response protein AidB-like acyl-CoA dehydrogenase
MDFNLNEDQKAFADTARALFADHCGDDALRAHDEGSEPFMRALWEECVRTGLQAIVIPEADGGLGQGATDLMAVLEQQGRAVAMVPLAEHQLAAAAIARYSPELSAQVMPALASGESLATLSLDDLRASRGLQLQARRDAGVLVLDGIAPAVPLGSQAAVAVLPVQFDGVIRLVAVPPQGAGITRVDGRSQHHRAIADLHFEHARVAASALLDARALPWLEPRVTAAIASLQLGVSGGQLSRTVEYVSQRKQFGRVIGSFQLVAGQMADAQIALEALRSALAQLVYRLDAGLGVAPQSLAVKVLSARAAHQIGHAAQHVHGGIGVDLTYPIHRYLYWSRALAFTAGGVEQALDRLGTWLASDERLGWKYDLPEDHGDNLGAFHAV